MDMASREDFVLYCLDQLHGNGDLRYRKMFGEYMIYVNDKPIILICNDTVYVKQDKCLQDEMQDARIGVPYEGAKPHYILDIEDGEFAKQIIRLLECNYVDKRKKK